MERKKLKSLGNNFDYNNVEKFIFKIKHFITTTKTSEQFTLNSNGGKICG